MTNNANQISIRKALFIEVGSYNDRNDGFCRTLFSRSKANHSRNTKAGKVKRVKPPHRQ